MKAPRTVSIDSRYTAAEAAELRRLAKEEDRTMANLIHYLVGLGLKARAAANHGQARIKKGSR